MKTRLLRKDGQKGFTLIEILMAAAIFGIITGGIFTIVLAAQRTWESSSGELFLTARLRNALGVMTRELAVSPVDQIIKPLADGSWDTTAIFRIPQDQNGDGNVLDANGNIAEWSVWTRYLLSANDLKRKLNAIQAATSQTIAGNISALQFRRQPSTPDVVEIQVTATAQKGRKILSRALNSRVKLRNLQSGAGAADEAPPDDF